MGFDINYSTFDPLTVDDESEWSWALHRPAFYLREFPVKMDPSSGSVTGEIKLDDSEDYEVSIYMMEHSSIDDAKVELVPEKQLQISGRVDLFGDVHDFVIKWNR